MKSKFFSRKSKDMLGTVTSLSGSKTLRVEHHYFFLLPKYGKQVKRRSIFLVHDEDMMCKVGDYIRFYITKPISRRKRCVVKSVEERVNNG